MKTHIFKLIIGFLILGISPYTIYAQEDNLKNSTPEERAGFQTEWMKTELSLDSSIVPSVYNINLKYAKENQSLIGSEASKLQKYKSFKASSEAKDNELKNIFTKDQYKLYQQKKDEMKQKMKQRIQEKRKNG